MQKLTGPHRTYRTQLKALVKTALSATAVSTKKQPAFGRIVDLPGDHIVILTTTHNVEGKQIVEYHNLVTGEAIVGANIFRDFFAGTRDVVGGRSKPTKKNLRKLALSLRTNCQNQLDRWAETLLSE